jgi:hypothetical protein
VNPPIAIQSWCYRHFKTIPSLIEKLKETCVLATEICGVHANFADATGRLRSSAQTSR